MGIKIANKDYSGKLLVSYPNNCLSELRRSVVVLVSLPNKYFNVVGLQINRVHEGLELSEVMGNLGFSLDHCQSVYYGGNSNVSRMHIVHSLDWEGISTIRLGNEVGVTSDISVLSALSRGCGPMLYRAVAGNWQWTNKLLEGQLDCSNEVGFRWELMDISRDSVFNFEGDEQWYKLWDMQFRSSLDSWFSRVLG